MPRMRSNLGGFEVGIMASTVLFGICTVQTVLYFTRFAKDPLLTRALVMILWLLQGVQIVLMCGTIYWDFRAPPSALPAELWPDSVWQAFGIVISGLVQVFYSRLSYLLCRSWPLNVILDALILLKFVVGFMYVIEVDQLAVMVEKEAWLGILLMVDDAVVDQFIALSLTYSLVKRRTRFTSTNTIITRLVLYALATGFTTSLLSLAGVISFIACENKWGFTTPSTLVSSLYFFAMLANLHTRSTLQKFVDYVEDVRIPFTTVEIHPSPARGANEPAPGAVHRGASDHKAPLPTPEEIA